MDDKRIEKLIGMGANRWTKYGKDRLYLRHCVKKLLKLEISRYNSGNISSAYLDGEMISNSQASRMMSMADVAYIDLISDEVVVGDLETGKAEEFKGIVEEAIENL